MNIFVEPEREHGAAREYLQQRKIKELFQSITVGLLHHRPEEPHQFILNCLDHVHVIGWEKVFWDTFLPRGSRTAELPVTARVHRESESKGPSASDDDVTAKEPVGRHSSKSRKFDEAEKPSSELIKAAEEDDARRSTMRRILRGSLEDLPPLPSNTIRIFLSSTFSDYKAERNILPRKSYPELSAFCRERGLDFQVVDMRWGVTDDMVNDHQVSELCIKEIAMCQQVSCGPNFVTLLGDRYGFRPFPVKIQTVEFDRLASIAARDMDEDCSKLLNDWFWKDENAVPVQYVLQPIPSKLQYYNDMTPENAEMRREARKEWDTTFEELRRILQVCSKTAVKEGVMDERELIKYEISVTENEVHSGLLKPEGVAQKALCYIRQLAGIGEKITDPKLAKFVDKAPDGNLDADAINLSRTLKEKIPDKLKEGHIRTYQPGWTGVPLEESAEREHVVYLKRFAQDFTSDMKALISTSLQNAESETAQEKNLYHEVLHHAKFARSKCEIFCGREKSRGQVQDYLTSTTSLKLKLPLIICGQSGFGKTSLLSYLAKCAPKWLNQDVDVILRLLGTSPNSSNILNTLQSVIHQVCFLFDMSLHTEQAMENINDVRQHFWSVLEAVGKDHPERKLVLILDSVDQLAETYGGHRMVWLPRTLPRNVWMIVSMLSDRYTCLHNTKLRLPEEDSFVELEPLSPTTGEEIIFAYMDLHHRCLTRQQMSVITEAFSKCRQPLFLKLVLDHARTWSSYTPVDPSSVATSVHEAITSLFETVEGTYGKVFVQKALGYLSCGHGGLSTLELEDVLSCDDEVLVDVYQYHDPPLDGTVRIPSLLWSRVNNALGEYLVERQVHGKTVLTWYHRQFWESAEKRYLSSEGIKSFHSTLADVFDQEKGIQKTIILTQRKGKVISDADRRVTPQTLTVSNVRKLECLPYHLLNANRTEELKSKCLINFTWMLTKLKALGVKSLLQEYNEMVTDPRMEHCKILELVQSFLELCYDALQCDVNLLAYHVKERMQNLTKEPLLQTFVRRARTWLQQCSTQLLLPTHPMNFLGLKSSLRFSIVVGYDGVLSSDEKIMVCNVTRGNSSQNKVQTLLFDTKDIMSSVVVNKKTLVALDKTNRFFLYFDMQRLKMREVESGDLVKEVMYGKQECESDVPRFLQISQTGKYLAVGVRYGKPRNLEGKSWKAECMLSLVEMDNFDNSIQNILFDGRKQVDSGVFVQEDTRLVCLSRDAIITYEIPSLVVSHRLDEVQGIYGRTYQHLEEAGCIVVGVRDEEGAYVMVYSYADNTYNTSKTLHIDEDTKGESIEPFAIQAKNDASKILIGLNTMELAGHNCLWLWEPDTILNEDAKYTQIPVGVGIRKLPTTMKATPDWEYLCVGWDNGELSMVSLEMSSEVMQLSAHAHAVHFTQILSEGRSLITMSSDHTLKMWDLEYLTQEAKAQIHQNPENDAHVRPAEEEGFVITKQDQCSSIECMENVLVTVDKSASVKLWNLVDGKLNVEAATKYQKVFAKSSKTDNCQVTSSKVRRQPKVKVYQTSLLLTQKTGHELLLSVMSASNDSSAPTVETEHLPEAFFHLAPSRHQPIDDAAKLKDVFVVRDGLVEVRQFPSLLISKRISIPRIAEDVGNINSHGGKRKLMHMTTAATFDGKYFILMNPSPPKQKDKYFHLIDLQRGTYVEEVDMESTRLMPWKIIGFYSFYFLVVQQGEPPEICGPRRAQEITDWDYRCLLYSEKSFLSEDLSSGFEFTQDYSVHLWRISTLTKFQTLKGHTTEVTSGCFSGDNGFFVSGSYDNTVRLWSTLTGQQLCMFHTYGAVDHVLFSPSASYIVVQCFATPERKRAVILKTHNVI